MRLTTSLPRGNPISSEVVLACSDGVLGSRFGRIVVQDPVLFKSEAFLYSGVVFLWGTKFQIPEYEIQEPDMFVVFLLLPRVDNDLIEATIARNDGTTVALSKYKVP